MGGVGGGGAGGSGGDRQAADGGIGGQAEPGLTDWLSGLVSLLWAAAEQGLAQQLA